MGSIGVLGKPSLGPWVGNRASAGSQATFTFHSASLPFPLLLSCLSNTVWPLRQEAMFHSTRPHMQHSQNAGQGNLWDLTWRYQLIQGLTEYPSSILSWNSLGWKHLEISTGFENFGQEFYVFSGWCGKVSHCPAILWRLPSRYIPSIWQSVHVSSGCILSPVLPWSWTPYVFQIVSAKRSTLILAAVYSKESSIWEPSYQVHLFGSKSKAQYTLDK